MDEEKYQKELFEFEQPKRSFSKLSEILPKADLEGRMTFTFTMEKIVFISIGIVMAMVVVYALGVESGKDRTRALARKKAQPVRATATTAVAMQAAGVVQPPAIAHNNITATANKAILNTSQVSVPLAKAKSVETNSKNLSAADPSKPYSILVATFRSKDSANATVSLLRNRSFDAFLVFNEPYYRVYAGSYANRSGSQIEKDLAAIKRIYKDAYIKLR
ncbi:MAG: SPOR domain-containing protein [Candidatus Omnitrophica bacterium]|nr:SPOR domain-containing protein [Candidatus Omnitrophota bacterium]